MSEALTIEFVPGDFIEVEFLQAEPIEVDFLMAGIGKSAYQTWLDQGNVGTEQDFITSLTQQVDPNIIGDYDRDFSQDFLIAFNT